ncbi:MAG: hypothetical protein HKL80_04835 [Acidimicrobiales bacterium]|nr:hypothetical protein [Acidimicrobiales bacterium]
MVTRTSVVKGNKLAQQSATLAELARALVKSDKAMVEKFNLKSIDDLLGKDGLLSLMIKRFLEELSKKELNEHLGRVASLENVREAQS